MTPALHLSGLSYLWCVLPCGLRTRQPLAQPISLINPLEESTTVCLLSYFLTHRHARSVGESWGFLELQWVSDRWTGGSWRAKAPQGLLTAVELKILMEPPPINVNMCRSPVTKQHIQTVHLWSLLKFPFVRNLLVLQYCHPTDCFVFIVSVQSQNYSLWTVHYIKHVK